MTPDGQMERKWNGKKVTPRLQAKYVELLRAGVGVSRAAEVCGVSFQILYRYRDNDPEFKAAWLAALEAWADEMEEELDRRGFRGVDEPVYYKGEVVGEVKKYDTTAAIFRLKAIRPEKYRERTELTGKDGGPIEVEHGVSREALLERLAPVLELKPAAQIEAGDRKR